MEVRALGRADRAVSALGFAAAGLGGERRRDLDPADAERALGLAIESGCTLIDAAPADDDGDGERRVGRMIRDLRARDAVVLAYRVPPAVRDGRAATLTERAWPERHLPGAIEDALRRTKLDALGLATLDGWRDAWLDGSAWPGLRGAMERLVREGKVLAWGIAARDGATDEATRALDEPLVAAVQARWHLRDRAAAPLLDAARARGVAVLARTPLDGGALAAAPDGTPTDPLAPYRALLGDEARSVVELALRFALTDAAIASVVCGMRRPAHVAANLALADGRRLSPALLDRLAELAAG